jgi:hypothetical protein
MCLYCTGIAALPSPRLFIAGPSLRGLMSVPAPVRVGYMVDKVAL